MPVSVPAFVNAAMLAWSRTDAGYSLGQAATALKRPEAQIAAWEAGEKQPSVRQAEALAKLYDRTLGFFSLPTPPNVAPLPTEYRRLPGVVPGSESPALRRSVRRLVHRRRIGLHLYAELGAEPVDFPLRAKQGEDAESVGGRIREALGISVQEQLRWPSEFAAYRAWRAAAERLGVLVCQFSGKDISGIRGTSIIHFPLPVVGICSREIPLSKPFTLLHEIVHISLAASDEEKPAFSEGRNDDDWLKVERYCEAAASAALMPKQAILEDRDVVNLRMSEEWDVDGVQRIARRFRVTPTAVATRLLWLGVISARAYDQWKESWAAYRESRPEKPGFGIATPPEKAVGRNGPLFTSLVLSALNGDRISSVDATHFLDLAFNHVETLRREWTLRPGAGAGG